MDHGTKEAIKIGIIMLSHIPDIEEGFFPATMFVNVVATCAVHVK